MRVLEGSNRVRSGLMGIIILIVVIGVGQSFTNVPMLFAKPTYYAQFSDCLLYTSPSPRDGLLSRMPSSA